jgi:hypothetical protein
MGYEEDEDAQRAMRVFASIVAVVIVSVIIGAVWGFIEIATAPATWGH